MPLFRNATMLLGASAFGVPLGFVTSVVLARGLDVADRGLFLLATNLAATLFVVGQFGWAANSVYQIRRAGRPPARVAGAGLVSTGFYCLLILPWVLASGDAWVERFLPGASTLVLWLCMATVPLQLLTMLADSLARALDRFDLGSVNRAAQTAGRFVAIGLALVVFDAGLIGALIAALVVWLGTSLWLATRVFRLSGISLPTDGAENRAMARFGLQSHALTFVARMHERTDVLLLAWLLADPTPTGLYAIALTIPAVMALVPESVSVAAYTAFAGEKDRRAVDLTAFVVRNVLVWVAVLWLVYAAVATVLLPLAFGAAYAPAVLPSLLLAFALGPAAAHRVIMRYLVASDRQPTTLRIYTAALMANALLNIALIPGFGVAGAATARIVSQTLCAVAMVVAFRRLTGVPLTSLLVPQRADLDVYARQVDRIWRRLRGG